MNQAPHLEYQFFNDDRCLQFIKDFYNDDILLAYLKLVPGAYRADLFRYLFAYLNPTTYCDIKLVCLNPFIFLYYYNIDHSIFVQDQKEDYIYNAFFVTFAPHNKIIEAAIITSLDNIYCDRYGEDPLSVTGPGVIGEALRKLSDTRPLLKNSYAANDWKSSFIHDPTGRKLFFSSYHGYYDELRYLETRHYSNFWKSKLCFEPSIGTPYTDVDSILFGVDGILWINLDRAKSRRDHMEQLFHTTSIQSRRIAAVDGQKKLPFTDESFRDKMVSSSEEACTLSHLCAIRQASEFSGDVFLIVEDDISLRFFPFLDEKDKIQNVLTRAPKDWDILQISWIYKSGLGSGFTDWNNCLRDHVHVAGTAAYLINRRGIQKILELFDF